MCIFMIMVLTQTQFMKDKQKLFLLNLAKKCYPQKNVHFPSGILMPGSNKKEKTRRRKKYASEPVFQSCNDVG